VFDDGGTLNRARNAKDGEIEADAGDRHGAPACRRYRCLLPVRRSQLVPARVVGDLVEAAASLFVRPVHQLGL
jgi:hypothetical protein